jgi:hypothetical protein
VFKVFSLFLISTISIGSFASRSEAFPINLDSVTITIGNDNGNNHHHGRRHRRDQYQRPNPGRYYGNQTSGCMVVNGNTYCQNNGRVQDSRDYYGDIRQNNCNYNCNNGGYYQQNNNSQGGNGNSILHYW